MSPKIATLPVTEQAMWRKLFSKVHSDASGDHELFVWTTAVREQVCSRGVGTPRTRASSPPPPPPPRAADGDRVPFDRTANFLALTWRALEVADDEDTPQVFSKLLWLLADCKRVRSGKQRNQHRRGASYKQLSLIAHKAGMTSS